MLPLRYAACGLTIAANRPISGLMTADALPADLAVQLRDGSVPIPPGDPADAAWYSSPERDASGTPWVVAARRGGDYWLRYSEGAAFCIDETGRWVDGWCSPPLTPVDADTYLLGPVLAFVSRLRDRVPLHASGVAIDGRAMLFAGDPGAGKSTTAAAFAALGVPVLSDDVVPIMPTDAGPVAWPGYPRLSLWADAADAVFSARPPLPAYSDTYEKRYIDLDGGCLPFQRLPLPVGGVFVLAGDEGVPARRLPPREALVALLRHTYGTYLIDMGMRAREFEVLARLVEAVPVFEVRFSDGLGALGAQCAALAARLRETARESTNASDT